MYPSEDAKRSLAHATWNCTNSTVACETVRIRTLNNAVTSYVRSNLAIVAVFPLGIVYLLDETTMPSGKFAQNIYLLKLEIAHSGPGNLSDDTTVYITTHEHLIKYLDVV